MTIGIIGAGSMGAGIAQIAALSGDEVILLDQTILAVEKGLEGIKQSLDRLLSKQKISNLEHQEALQRILPTDDAQQLRSASLCIEAVFEDMAVKQSLFSDLEKIVPQDCIIATNTSSLSVTKLASCLRSPERFAGMHFFNPPALMPLVEIIPAAQTALAVTQNLLETATRWGKTAVVAKDTPGFIVNKVARPYYSEAIRMVEEGFATIEEIDEAMTSYGFKMGPFTLMDFIGHDVNFRVTESVWKGFFYDGRYKPSLLQQRLLDAGYLGKKTGRGFYIYDGTTIGELTDFSNEKKETIFWRIISMLVNEAADTVYMGVCSQEDLEKAVTLGVNYPKGLFAWGQELGMARIVENLDAMFLLYHEERYRVCPLLRTLAKL
ncbi:MAG: 3-hydroxyacyl-CoA dehydrogenase NAD-binding domain-containing protein [Saprospiraceae bacterium]|jgi:3-hydroxybutyryl-CoA dehydrogenase|nr:3-hydroxyacyl-CoA dehydrogenase NAD-binding domain-containing protein [Saprospiraceae bacterium]